MIECSISHERNISFPADTEKNLINTFNSHKIHIDFFDNAYSEIIVEVEFAVQ